MKEVLRGTLGVFGVIIYFIFAYGVAFYPLIFIAMPWWLCAIIAFFLSALNPIYSSIGTLILYVIALLSVTIPGIDVLEIILFVFAGIFLLFEVIPNVCHFIWAWRGMREKEVFFYDPDNSSDP